ncbi:methyltransferase dimerization domain-containing protein [Streptomyces sp. WAC07094]|uniref:methyltransferase family protein n=1 Tax=Streptomyces sp. WAC07094 TaxID=3072183 RepID=UPI002EA1F900|nr:methyltransferase dimerization domain-containing protein [Streptomyces sp. WAC07094]
MNLTTAIQQLETSMSVNESITPEPILRLGLGFMASKTLLSAVELNIFTVLARGGRDRASIAAEVGLHPKIFRRLPRRPGVAEPAEPRR